MKNLAKRAVTVAAALALSVGALPATASAAPVSTAAPATAVATAKVATAKSGTKLAIKTSAKSFHHGQTGPKVTVTVKKGSKAASGKVTFFDGKKKIKTVKLKKGKATIRLKSSLKVGKHKITAKYGKASKSVKVTVHNSALKVTKAEFTVSKSDPYGFNLDPVAAEGQKLTGTIKYKGKPAKKGYVDIYRNGKTKGGASSPDYITMTGVQDGKFSFSSNWLASVADKLPVGTHKFKAFYTPGFAFADYVHSSWITVTVTD